jgi:hypothetical protein
MESDGGARVERSAEGSIAAEAGVELVTWATTSDSEVAVVRGWGCAHCGVATARQQSWVQQALAPMTAYAEFSEANSWQWRVLRMQQAWGAAGIAACASGRNVPISANNKRNLAVSRGMASVVVRTLRGA